jgi:hypothetical protein
VSSRPTLLVVLAFSESLRYDGLSMVRTQGIYIKYLTHREVIERGNEEWMLEWEGINPYKVYEMFKIFRPYVPVEYQSDPLYAEPSPEVPAKVMAEKVDRKEFRATMKRKK